MPKTRPAPPTNHPVFALALAVLVPLSSRAAAQPATVVEAPLVGGLDALDGRGRPLGPCALKHTEVDVRISFPFARVTVAQTFHNPFDEKIEAVYALPLGADAAVDSLEMVVGERVIRGEVRERGAAREEYEAARRDGLVASLLDEERPNVFTQSVANVEPGAIVTVRIGTIETLATEGGVARFSFPMTVAPRYAPKPKPKENAEAGDGGEASAPGAAIPSALPATRAGHAVSLRVRIDSGGPGLADVRSALHAVTVADEEIGPDGLPRSLTLELARGETIPNRDFALSFRLVPDGIRESVFAHASPELGRFVTLVLAPPDRATFESAMPRELVFVVDVSGSMAGAPIGAAKAIVSRALDALREDDTFNLVTFAGHTDVLFAAARPATSENRAAAAAFLAATGGGGGTEMMTAIRAALEPEAVRRTVRRGPRRVRVLGESESDEPAHTVAPVRVVAFLTDGLVENDLAILDAVRRHAATTRVFSFGIGASVNRFLIDGLARAGRGAAEIVLPGESADAKVETFLRRLATPVLTDVTVEFSGGIEAATDLVPDLFDSRPLVLHARAARSGRASVTVRGTTPLGPYEESIAFDVPDPAESDGPHAAIAALWARDRVERLLWQDLAAAQRNVFPEPLRAEIVKLGETFRIATPFTSFVAVDRETPTSPVEPRRTEVPLEAPAGGFGRSWGQRPPAGRTPNDPSPRGATRSARGGGRRAATDGYERFEFYWEHEREALVPPPARFSRPKPAEKDAAIRTIERALGDPDPEVRAAAAIALGRSRAAGAEAALVALLTRHEDTVTPAAALGLGLLGRAAAARPLLDLLEGGGSPAARPRTRAFAAAALALVVEDDGAATTALVRALRDPEIETAVLAAVALGARGGERAAAALAALAADKSAEPFLRAHAVAALGRAGGPSSEAILRDALDASPQPVARSAARAFGSLRGPLDAASLAALRAKLGPERGDIQIRNWALIAIGRAGDDSARGFLADALDGEVRTSLSAAALGLALHGRRTPLDEKDLSRLRGRLADCRDPSASAALAIALGLLRDEASIGALRSLLARPVSPSLRGAAAEALALMGDAASTPDLLALYRDPTARRDEDLARSLRHALARLACRDAAPLLLADVERAGADPRAAASAALALGTLGDASVLPRLAHLAGSETAAVRAHAIVATGLVLADDPAAMKRAFSSGVNYRALLPALNALLDVL